MAVEDNDPDIVEVLLQDPYIDVNLKDKVRSFAWQLVDIISLLVFF
jgi:hypothetical protein